MSSIAAKYRRRAEEFAERIAAVAPEQWENPSPCEEWTAGEVFAHVIDMHSVMLQPLGRSSEIAFSADADPIEQFRRASALIEAVLTDPELSQVESEIPGVGPAPLEQEIDTVLSQDLAIHSWDVAVSVGLEGSMHPDDVSELWQRFSHVPAEVMEQFRTPNAFGPGVTVFGPEVSVAASASQHDKLLAFIGRDPNWTSKVALRCIFNAHIPVSGSRVLLYCDGFW